MNEKREPGASDKDNDALVLAALDAFRQPESAAKIAAKHEVDGLPDDVRHSLLVHHLAQPVAAALSAGPLFPGGTGFMVARKNGESGFHAQQAADALVEKVLQGNTPGRCVERDFASHSVD